MGAESLVDFVLGNAEQPRGRLAICPSRQLRRSVGDACLGGKSSAVLSRRDHCRGLCCQAEIGGQRFRLVT